MINEKNTNKENRLPIQVAIADDSPVIREGLIQMLGQLPEAELVWQAGSVTEAITASRLMSSDVIILDVEMPDGKGIEVLEAVKHRDPGTIVMILTNYAIAPLQKKYCSAGADYFYDKSTEFKKVFETLREMISKRTNQKEN